MIQQVRFVFNTLNLILRKLDKNLKEDTKQQNTEISQNSKLHKRKL
jgi:hypothetical protein